MTYAVMAPEHPLVATIVPDERRAEVEAFVAEVRMDQRHRPHVVGGRARQAGRLHRRLPAQPVHRHAGAAVPGRLRADGLRHRGDHGGARPRTSATGTSPGPRPARSSARSSRPRAGRARRTPATARTSTASGWTAGQGRGHRHGHRLPRGRGHRRGARSTSGCATGWCHRQRFWGCPIPVVYCADCGIVPVPDDQLPVLAPDDVEFLPDGRVAAAVSTRASCTPPARSCGGPAVRETDTMDTFVDSSWYFLRFCDPWNDDAPFGRGGGELDAGRPVHRWRRARHPAPDVRPLLHQGAGRPGRRAEGAARAVHPPVHPGHDPPGRRQDVEVQGQPGRARGDPRHRGRRRAAPGPPVRRSAAGRRRLGGRRHRGLLALPAAACGASAPGEVGDRRRPRRRRRPTSRSTRPPTG